ncbi:MAG: hypothetical protein WCP59_17930 [Actinomycetota bacterium]
MELLPATSIGATFDESDDEQPAATTISAAADVNNTRIPITGLL